MTIWISREVPLFNFECLDILFAWIEHPSEKLWPFEFLESFICSMSSVPIYFVPESDIRVISYDHLNFSRASVVQFRASRYIMRLNWTSESKVMTIWTSWELPLCNFERLQILYGWIGHLSEKFWPFEFLESFRCSISSVSTWYGPESNIRVKSHDHFKFLERFCCSISSVSIYYVPESDILVKSYDHLNFSLASVVQFRVSRYILFLNWTSKWKVMTIVFSREHPFFNFELLDILCTKSDIQVKSYDHLNFSRASVIQFGASRSIISPYQTFEWKVMTIWISQELPLFNFERLDILCA